METLTIEELEAIIKAFAILEDHKVNTRNSIKITKGEIETAYVNLIAKRLKEGGK